MTTTARRWSGSSPEQRRVERRSRILDAGLREFGSRGFHATTVLGLCAAARVSARDFYGAFASREALFVEVYRMQVAQALGSLTSAVDLEAARSDPETALVVHRAVGAYLDHLVARPLAARVVHREVLGVGAAVELERRRAIALFENALDERLAAVGGVPPGTGLGIVGVANEMISSELLGSAPPDLRRLEEPITRLIVRLLTPEPTGST